MTIGLAIVGGIIAGFITSRSFFKGPDEFFHDKEHWTEVEEMLEEQEHGKEQHFNKVPATLAFDIQTVPDEERHMKYDTARTDKNNQ